MCQEENVVEIKNLVKDYKMFTKKQDRLIEVIFPIIKKHSNFRAMNNLDLTIKKGEVLGILGKNGAGKSTLLKMITGVVVPTFGELKVNGKISSLLELGTAFNMELSGLENIYQHGQVMGLTKKEIEEKKQEIIDFADIGDHLYQPVKTYSSGMFARLAFACAINVNPDILIVDEVLSVGDMAFQLKCFKKFQDFKEKGKTILFVTHNVSDVLKNCTRAIILENGSKTFDGDVKEGVELYKKVITGNNSNNSDNKEHKIIENKKNKKVEKQDNWKSHFNENPNIIEYGNLKAEVIDYGVFDDKGNFLASIDNDKEIILKSKIRFNETIDNPIFTMTIKDFNGIEIVGTNTMNEKIYPGKFEKDEIVTVEFKQVLPLAPNKYTLSFSCTYINSKGELEVLNRKYEALLIEIISSKDCVGFLRINPEIKILKANNE
ncbi:MAG: ABC transporter ATP-binding protein [Clostridiaceae bacterium]|nr:ABC transporter ATP-binding protein [Clostridiaceae bacterium]